MADDFQFASPAPFENTYLDHRLFYQALLGKGVEEGTEHFRAKAFAQPIDQAGPEPMETYVDLLVRVGKNGEALEITLQHLSHAEHVMGIAPQPFEIARNAEDYQKLREHFRTEGDLMRYGICTLQSQ